MARHLHLDPFAGIAGDMFLAACVDLGAGLEAIDAALKPLPIDPPYRLRVETVVRHGLRGTNLHVDVGEFSKKVSGTFLTAHHHHHVTPRDILLMINYMDAPDRAKQRARNIVMELGTAEAAVHGVGLDQVHFHEVGATDSIVDMLGAAVALELLDVETVSCAALPIGHGFVKCAHGLMPLPAPATAELLKGIPHYGVDRECETVTPTGAALVKALTHPHMFGHMPAMTVENVGYGAGDRIDPDVPNMLRAHLGRLI